MGDLQRLFGVTPARRWTEPETYLEAMARKRRLRRTRATRPRTQPERPRLMLSTLPFLAVFALLAVLAVAIMVMAYPGNQPAPHPRAASDREQGVAQRGWFQEAQKQFHS